MKKNQILPIIIGILFSLSTVARADEEADHVALRMIKTNYEDAVNSSDPSKFKNNLGTQFTGVMVTGDTVTGYDGLLSYWKEIQGLIGPGGSYHVTVNTDKTDLFGDVAVSRGTTEESVRLSNGKELDFGSYWTAVCHKEDGTWKAFRVQATMNPVHNVFVSLQLERAKLTYGILGFVAGIILALLLQFIRHKPKTQSSAS